MGPAPSTPPVQTITVTAPRHTRGAWRQLLGELNPLQYLPVVGTIYRAATGDTIPEPVREAGSLVVSGLTGGPAGLAISLAALAVERLTGIDPEAIGETLLHQAGIGATPAPPAHAPSAPPPPAAWSKAQLAAYGIRTGPEGELRRGADHGADVLNGLELARLSATA